MAARTKYPLLNLRGANYEFSESREPGERVRTIGIIDIDYSVFRKDKHERDILKLAKLQCKAEEMKK